jgi:hypothetical protein
MIGLRESSDMYIRFSLKDFAIEPRSKLPSKIVACRITSRTQMRSFNNLSIRNLRESL